MNRTPFAIAFLLLQFLPHQSLAADDSALRDYITGPCVFVEEDPQSCFGVAGCIGTEGAYIVGRVKGWGAGLFEAATSEGHTCSGSFVYREFVEMAKSKIECSNEETVEVTFFTRNKEIGVGQGQGRSTLNRRFEVWAGRDITQFLTSEKEDGSSGLICGGVAVPLD